MSSYRQIFKSTALIGGTQIANVVIGIVRTKVLALLLGTGGMGLAGIYLSATSLISNIAGLGISSSGVRQVAEAMGSGDLQRVGRTVAVLRRASFASGVLGMLMVLLFCKPLSRLSFNTEAYAGGIALVSLTLLFSGLSGGQSALLQGMRRLRDMAVSSVLGTLMGTFMAIVVIYFLREKGIALFLVVSSGLGVLLTWYYSRRVEVPKVALHRGETWRELKGLLGLGLAMVAGTLMSTGLSYLTRILIVHKLGLETVGLYSAAWMLSSYYVNIILGAMATDFYPRLTAAASDNAVVNRLVNEQTQVGMLLSVPGVVAFFVAAPWFIQLFYSPAFLPAVEVVRWMIAGVGLRVISFPLGYMQLAKAKAKLFLITDGMSSLVHLFLIIAGLHWWGLKGIGMAFTANYAVYTLLMTAVCRRLSGFSWAESNLRTMVLAFCGLAAAAMATSWLSVSLATVVGAVVVALCATYSLVHLRRLTQISPRDWLAARFGRVGLGKA